MSKSLSEICDGLSGRISSPPVNPVRLSSWENCPLCDSAFLEVHEDGIYKPEVVCMDCGISLQGETVFDIKTKWNRRGKEYEQTITTKSFRPHPELSE